MPEAQRKSGALTRRLVDGSGRVVVACLYLALAAFVVVDLVTSDATTTMTPAGAANWLLLAALAIAATSLLQLSSRVGRLLFAAFCVVMAVAAGLFLVDSLSG